MFRHAQAILFWLASCTFAYMKKVFLLMLLLAGMNAHAQKAVPLKEDTLTAPYLKYKELPAFDAEYLNGADTFNTFNIPTGKPVLIIYFSPDCDHCQKMIDEMLPQMDRLKNVNVYMMTFMPLIALKIFNSVRHMETHENIKFIGRDISFFFPTFYGTSSVPNVVLYDKNKKFIKLWPNGTTIADIEAELK
jgi:thioredoxin-related protein